MYSLVLALLSNWTNESKLRGYDCNVEKSRESFDVGRLPTYGKPLQFELQTIQRCPSTTPTNDRVVINEVKSMVLRLKHPAFFDHPIKGADNLLHWNWIVLVSNIVHGNPIPTIDISAVSEYDIDVIELESLQGFPGTLNDTNDLIV
jgi:hypothetical protein